MSGGPRATALEFIAAHHVMTLATHGTDGPWAAAVFYASDGFDLYFVSTPRALHSRHLAANPVAAAAIQAECADWREIKGVQMAGTVAMLAGDEAARARTLYEARFPMVHDEGSTAGPIAAALSRVSWYRFSAHSAFFIDNAAGFGKRQQVL